MIRQFRAVEANQPPISLLSGSYSRVRRRMKPATAASAAAPMAAAPVAATGAMSPVVARPEAASAPVALAAAPLPSVPLPLPVSVPLPEPSVPVPPAGGFSTEGLTSRSRAYFTAAVADSTSAADVSSSPKSASAAFTAC